MSFYQDVADVVKLIPKHRITTYGIVANSLALGSARMVGWALNKIEIQDYNEIPAHRVVNRHGELSGKLNFPHPDFMQKMLESEGFKIENNRIIDFEKYIWQPEDLILK